MLTYNFLIPTCFSRFDFRQLVKLLGQKQIFSKTCLFEKKHVETRMYSSRMRIARSLPDRGGGLPDKRPPLDRDPPGQRPQWTDTPLDRDPLDRDPPWTETPLDRDPLVRDPPWIETPPPTVDRQTPVKTLPSQTSFAGGKNSVLMFLHSSKFEGFEINNSYISNYERGSLLLSVQGIDLLRYVFCENCFIIHRLSSGKNIFTARPPGRYTPRAGTPPGQVHPLGQVHPPGQVPSSRQVHPPRAGTPPRAVHAGIRSTSGRYASYWNAFLYICQIGQI